MCWNKEVSLNTFLFSSFVLGLVVYNARYTKYKMSLFQNNWIVVFFMSFIVIQLIEYFIWKNIKHPFYNTVFSTIAAVVVLLQPMISLMLIQNNLKLRNVIMFFYLLYFVPFVAYKAMTKRVHTIVNDKGNLSWQFFGITPFGCAVWLFTFLFPLLYMHIFYGFLFGVVTVLIIFMNYKDKNSISSLWCWVVNSVMVFCAGYLLFYLPFKEKMRLC